MEKFAKNFKLYDGFANKKYGIFLIIRNNIKDFVNKKIRGIF